MAIDMKGKNLISIGDLSLEEIKQIIKTTEILKMQKKVGQPHSILKGKILAMIFEKPSTRTRVSFEVAMLQLGGHSLYLPSRDLQLERGETIADTSRVLSRYVDGIMARVFSHDTVITLAQYSSVPVINGLSDKEHPCQILGDLFTIYEKKGRIEGLKLAYVGDGNNVANSLILGCAITGMKAHTAHPEGYYPDEKIVEKAKKLNGNLTIGNDPKEAVKDADVIYTDVWVSMGYEEEKEERKIVFQPYQVNSMLLAYAKPDCIIMHCLPAHRGEEITDEVMDGKNSVIFDQAENRLYVQKAILSLLIR